MVIGLAGLSAAAGAMQLFCLQRVHANVAPNEHDLDERAHRVEDALIAPCCFMQTLANHSSPKADEMKREIRDLLQQGWSEDRVLQYYLDKYGERILAVPVPKGFNVLAYVVPPVVLAIASAGVAVWIRRHTAKPGASTPATDEKVRPALDPALVERVRAELASFE
jgi:cytochrome c-type biogenesis protein CcmH